jgi:ribonuclease-3
LQSLDKRNKEKMLENAYEAWIGAIYLDLGIDYARKFIQDQYEKHVEWDKVVEDTNYKDQILRYCQSNNMELPVYNVVGQEGPPHNRIFTIQLQIGDKVYSQGKGPQKKIGEQIAAQNTLKQINNNV